MSGTTGGGEARRSDGGPAAGTRSPGVPIPILEGTRAAAWVARRAAEGRGARGPEVRPILERVRAEGDAALLELGEALDGVRPPRLRVPPERCARALATLRADRRLALERAARNVARFHATQRRREEAVEIEPGVRAWREFRPIGRVGIYAPGGRASYPSTVLMTVVPARVAGCREVVVCSPPGPDGEPAPSVLAAAALAGAHEIYAVGGAQAVAAMAYGTETVRRVDKIFGPGNAWVGAAKLAVASTVPIDLVAGPSEVVAWADALTPPAWTAAELLAQAEHGPDSLCVGILPDRKSAAAVREALQRRLDRPHRREPTESSLARSALLVAGERETALGWIEALAPEHLALLRADARRIAPRIFSAGSVFLGPFASVAVGDYAAGPNHVLPTGGRARAESGLSLDAFGRWIQFQEIDRSGLARLAPAIRTLAEWEGLPAHAAAVAERLRSEDGPRGAAQGPGRVGGPRRGEGRRRLEPGARRPAAALVRSELSRLQPYATARSLHRGGVLLDANENPFPPPVGGPVPDLNRYPDPRTPTLRAMLAERLGIREDGLWVGNGSDEAIDLLLRGTSAPGEACVVPVPTYGVYAARAAAWGVSVRQVPLDGAFDLDVEVTREAAAGATLVFLCSPNNPTGNVHSADRILELASSVSCVVAVDEAYVEFSDHPSLAPRTRELPNLVVIRTFSKAWGLAGARVGYLVGDPALVELLDGAALPYPLSALAAGAAEAVLRRETEMERRRDRLVAERGRLRAGIEGLGIRVLPSEANFLLFFVGEPERVQRELAETHGVVVRNRSGLPRLAGGLRVSVGRPEENDLFLDGLARALGRAPAGPDAGRNRGGAR